MVHRYWTIDVGLPIDIQVLNKAPAPFRNNVAETGILLTSRDSVFYEGVARSSM
ncbi:MAG: hypothetical protein GF411_05995 [Candidatus Lokiarchaeota archaeon]|nr:hypothetical protein [Candidatus Lokiarchaeota archaeon]